MVLWRCMKLNSLAIPPIHLNRERAMVSTWNASSITRHLGLVDRFQSAQITMLHSWMPLGCISTCQWAGVVEIARVTECALMLYQCVCVRVCALMCVIDRITKPSVPVTRGGKLDQGIFGHFSPNQVLTVWQDFDEIITIRRGYYSEFRICLLQASGVFGGKLWNICSGVVIKYFDRTEVCKRTRRQ